MPMRRNIDVVVSGSGAKVVDLTLRRPGTIRGIAEDVAAEALLEGVPIRLLDANGSPITSQLTDAQGAYLFESLPPGSYRVSCQAPRGYTVANADMGVAVRPGEDLEVDFDLEPAGAVQGRILDEDTGEPLAGVTIVLVDSTGREVRRVESAVDGTYEFRRLPEDKYTVAIEDA